MQPQLNLSATSILALFETTKEQRQSFVTQTVTEITEGLKNPLEIHYQIKCLEEILSGIKEDGNYKEALLTEAQKHGKSFDFMNSRIEVKEVGTKYDYSNCNDAIYSTIESEFKEAERKLKERQKFLQLMPQEGIIITDEQTGETAKVYPAIKSSTTSIAVKLK